MGESLDLRLPQPGGPSGVRRPKWVALQPGPYVTWAHITYSAAEPGNLYVGPNLLT